MSSSSLSMRFALVLSLSLAASYSSSSARIHHLTTPIPSSSSASSSSPPLSSFSIKPWSSSTAPKASASDLISLLGAEKQASTVNPLVANELRSCLKFLVPFSPSQLGTGIQGRLLGASRREVDELVWWPPRPVLELARLAVDSGGDPGAIHLTLDPTVIPVPDVEGSKENKCELTRTPYGRRFINEELNSYIKFLFELIAARGPSIGLNVSLSRYDLFHGHLFIASDSRRLGILFHAKEYPACEKEIFPYNMGYCQLGSTVTYDDSMNFRNILWLAPLPGDSTEPWAAPGVLVVLDAHPGGIIYRDLIPEYVKYVRTIYEDDFGEVVVDVNYLNVGDKTPDYQIFIC
ncbi:uncharacterized protein LOC131153105 [Malania oleifera]|uniref:uncharacterized protein LOC131153105 n=1 Tax=Malania oleifera TaxID=397392 RepID=UPI0025ADF947|nr:uncharacterized protein LOC131153105 [Malania oleifera]XP_057961141.1 uncharacterized protein LOC131153105 [Malania oleifera]XP_057961142.1 uncharacterized protein LOC131153105 [Malania oleifera]XP_057961143.1 uncharacterized protein LOC131153105 [Malania oleifera]